MSDSMHLERVSAGEFAEIFPKGSSHMFNSVEFSELNAGKTDQLHYLLMGDTKWRMGIILGQRGGRLLSPFSAPFGGYLKNGNVSVEVVHACVDLTKAYAQQLGMKAELFLPPAIYDPELYAKTVNTLMLKGEPLYTDISYHYDLRGLDPDSPEDSILSRMNATARKHFNRASRLPFHTELLGKSSADIERAYNVIAANRRWKGYPLRMTLDDVIRTAPIADTECIVMSLDGEDVAAAVIYHVTPEIMQVVYWGDAPGHDKQYAMSRFTYDVFRQCYTFGASVLDIGPSSEDGIPSVGLCAFKESIGCIPSIKPRFSLG